MKMKSGSPFSLGDLFDQYNERKKEIRRRLADFAAVPPSGYFYELIYCLMTPQSSASSAEKGVRALQAANFREADIDPEPFLHQPGYYIRFHKSKARHLLSAKAQFGAISETLAGGADPAAKREWLVDHVAGMGWKEASHFLRNIGYRDLAILDRHILRNMKLLNIIDEVPKTLPPKLYLSLEGKFRKFGEEISIPMDELDLLFWSKETGSIMK
jgi:N-glycosylase/DNA lyase